MDYSLGLTPEQWAAMGRRAAARAATPAGQAALDRAERRMDARNRTALGNPVRVQS